jgi:hypothetical protein
MYFESKVTVNCGSKGHINFKDTSKCVTTIIFEKKKKKHSVSLIKIFKKNCVNHSTNQ